MATAWWRVNRVRVPRNPYAQPGDCVLHMAQEIVSRHKHNMLSLLYATCLKLLVSFFFLENTFTNWASVKNSLEAFGTMPSSYLEYSKTKILLILLENLWVATQVTTVSYISLLAPIGYRRTTPNLSPLTAHRHNLGYGRATEIQPKHQTENIALPYVSWWLLAIILPSY